MALPCIYTFYLFMFTPPPIFNSVMIFSTQTSIYMQSPDKFYENKFHAINNIAVCIFEPLLYATLILLYVRATRSISQEIRKKFLRDKRLYLQVIIVGFVHFVASFCYVLMQHITVSFYTTLIASTFYLMSQGIPPVVYLLVNNTLRNTTLELLGLRRRAQLSANLYSYDQKTPSGVRISATYTTYALNSNPAI
ncbi:hypothetical protein M3Y97_00731900 [Aphelenchoides bicaudatus]|nr:hypothetical protein M3Y97_00731900 [Aphelenchoides bicaudatus]